MLWLATMANVFMALLSQINQQSRYCCPLDGLCEQDYIGKHVGIFTTQIVV